jgi:hypothetical protein
MHPERMSGTNVTELIASEGLQICQVGPPNIECLPLRDVHPTNFHGVHLQWFSCDRISMLQE